MKKISIFFAALAFSAMAMATDYKLVTNASDLKAGKHYIIGNAASGDAIFMSTTDNKNNRRATAAIAVLGGSVTATDEVMVLTLDSTESGYTFATNNYLGTAGYLNASSTTSSNYLKVVADLDAYAYFSIAIATDGKATVTCLGKTSRNLMRFNSDGMFACYTSGQNDIYLYVESAKAANAPVKSITADNSKDTVEVGDKLTLKYTIDPDTATDQRVEFAIVSGSEYISLTKGVVTGLAEGDAQVKVTALDSLNKGDKLYATFNIHVKAAKLNTCADVNAAAKDDKLKLNEVTVVSVISSNIYVKDASGSTLVYKSNNGLKAGDVVSGIQGKASPYNGLPELAPTNTPSDWTITAGEAPAIPAATAAPTAAEVNQVLEWKGVTGMSGDFTTSGKETIKGAFGTDTIAFYNNFKFVQNFDNTHSYDITGAVAIYSKDDVTTIQVYFISAKDNGVFTSLISTEAKKQVRKAMINGQMVIIKDGEMFNALGVKL